MTKFLSNWMKYLDGSKLISEFTIPGTHDSGTYRTTNGLAACQTMSLQDQLNNGIRFLDIRLKRKDNTLRVYHNFYNMKLDFKDVLNTCKLFLEANPSETIIMSIKHEKNDYSKEFEKEVWAVIQQYGLFYTNDHLPALDTVRSKIVLFRRYWAEYTPSESKGLDAYSTWPDEFITECVNSGVKFCIQDNFNKWGYTRKNKFINWILPVLNQASSPASERDRLFINFTSGVGPTVALDFNPRDVAKVVNPMLFEHIKYLDHKRFGIVIMDFPEIQGLPLIKKLIELNQFERYMRTDLNGKRLRRISDGALYLVMDGFIHHVTDPTTANRLFGNDWGVDNSENPDCVSITEALPVNAYLVKFEGSDAIYLTYKREKDIQYMLRHIPNPTVLANYGLYGKVELKPASMFSSFHVAAPLPAPS